MVVMIVALDDCTRSVTRAPQKEPRNGVAAALPSTVRSPEPASDFRPSVMTVMPSRKRPTPPSTEIAVDIMAPEVNDDQACFRTVVQPQCECSGVMSDVCRSPTIYFSRLRAARTVCNSFFFSASTVG